MRVTGIISLLVGASLISSSVYANEEDIRFLRQSTSQQLQLRKQSYREAPPQALDPSRHITLGGQTYYIGDSTKEQELAIYYAINAQLWEQLPLLLARYSAQSDHQAEVVLLAEGLLARSKGQFNRAIFKLEEAHNIAPENPRVQLELARIYAEDYQDKKALVHFKAVGQHPLLPVETQPIINGYIDGIDQRHRWHGSISVGYGYSDNINQGNGSEICGFEFLGQCLITQSLPKAVGSAFRSYQISLQKRIPIAGNHSLLVRPILYGNHYNKRDHQTDLYNNYSENTAILYAGYSYKDAKTEFNLLPFFEYYHRGGKSHYTTPGIELSVERRLSEGWSFNAHTGVKRHRYASSAKEYFTNYTQSFLGVGLSYQFSPTASIYAGVDYTRRKYPWATSSSQEIGGRIGAFKYFNSGFYVNVMGVYKDNEYDEKTFLADKPRRDKQSMFIAAIGAPRWNYKKIYPEIRFKQVRSKSNIVFYDYKQKEISLNLKYNF